MFSFILQSSCATSRRVACNTHTHPYGLARLAPRDAPHTDTDIALSRAAKHTERRTAAAPCVTEQSRHHRRGSGPRPATHLFHALPPAAAPAAGRPVGAPRGRTSARARRHRALYLLRRYANAQARRNARNTRIAPVWMSPVSVLNYARFTWHLVREARRCGAPSEGWLARLPSTSLKGDVRRNCVQCNMDALSRSKGHPAEVWTVSRGVHRLQDLPQDALWFVGNSSHKAGWVPTLLPQQALTTSTGWRKYPPKHRLPVDLPCSSARGEDAAVLRTFFTDRESGAPLRGGTFLEIGGANGLEQSNSWIFEVCLGWRGVLVEAHPRFFAQLTRHRPASLNLHFAACAPGMGSWANFSAALDWRAHDHRCRPVWIGPRRSAEIKGQGADARSVWPARRRIGLLGVQRLDFISVDVEAPNCTYAARPRRSPWGGTVEVRGDGVRPGVMRFLLRHGMTYVGQFSGRGTAVNSIIDDVFVNITHMARFFPQSSALKGLHARRAAENSKS